jgi:hypothetical protein
MMTAAIMNEAVTGTAKPRMRIVTAAKRAVKRRLPPAKAMMRELILSPSPVSVTTATMIPAAAQVAATGRTPIAPAAKAAQILRGPILCSRSKNESKNATPVAITTARKGVYPIAMRMTIRKSELKW